MRRFLPTLAAVLAFGCSGRGREPVNIVFISIDSLRADHVGAYGYSRETSPTLDRLAAEGALFENAVAESSWTLPTHATMLTGLGSLEHGVDRFTGAALDGQDETVAERLKREGYVTWGIYSGPYLHPIFGFGRGFDGYEGVAGETALDRSGFALDQEDAGRTILSANAKSHRTVTSPLVSRKAIDFLSQRRERPFFLFLHYFDVHYDYIPPEELWRRFDPDYQGTLTSENFRRSDAIRRDMSRRELEHVIALYDGEILFTDQHVASVLEALEAKGLASNTLVVVTSDHGDEFFEHGGKGHGQTLYDEVLRVPLIVRLPGRIPAGLRVREQVRHLDITPTLLSFAGVDARLRGHDLGRRLTGGEDVPALEALSTLRRNGDWFSYRTPGFKYLVHRDGSQEEEFLFDLDRDSGEEQTLVRRGETSVKGREAEVLARLREGLRKEESVGRARGSGRQERMEVPSDVLQQLRSLGYIEKP